MAQPLQLIVTGEGEDNCFVLREDNLATIINKIPPNTKVGIVSVVGAFRTGKSFLLNFFLRYLRNSSFDDLSQTWMVSEGDVLSEGNMNEGWNLVEASVSKAENSFAWRGGQERQTTGIWMWSEPFIRSSKTSGEKIAVLLMDTQGMFDNETTMTLTAQIFGLSTLVSSFQIYNVDKRIQEDNLQHLALFSEYGRMALQPRQEDQELKIEMRHDLNSEKGSLSGDLEIVNSKSGEVVDGQSETESGKSDAASTEGDTSATDTSSAKAETPSANSATAAPVEEDSTQSRPFQRLQFLVRDWQNFDNEFEEGAGVSSDSQYAALCGEMSTYLAEVLRVRGQSDLQSTREQITRCFGKLDCFMLPHPGFAVTKKNYDGSISKIEPFFRSLVNRYVRYVFDEELEAKRINNRLITGKELQTYFEVYVKMFQAGQKSFPKAMTMLDATAEANNRNASDLALAHYKDNMETIAGIDKPYVKEADLQSHQESLLTRALQMFDEMATMGSPATISKMREALLEMIESERVRYTATNALRNPFKDVEMYIIPVAVALAAWVLAVFVNATCSTDFCEATEDTFVNVYLFVFFGIVVLTWKHIRGALMYMKEILPVLLQTNAQK